MDFSLTPVLKKEQSDLNHGLLETNDETARCFYGIAITADDDFPSGGGLF